MSNNMLTPFQYEGNNVTFYEKDGMYFINATEMCKPFGEAKKPALWLRTSSAKEYIEQVSEVQKCTSADLQRVSKGGPNQGTWFQKDVAMEYARWLSPKFALWCNQKIEELLTKGHTSISPNFTVPQTFSEALMLAAKKQAEIEQKQKQLEMQDRQIQSQKDTIKTQLAQITCMKDDSEYLKKILSCPSLINTTSIAQDYGMSALAFNKLLHSFGIQYKTDGQWIVTAKYKACGYVKSETIVIQFGDKNSTKAIQHTKWTHKGMKFLYEFLKKKGVLPLIEKMDESDIKEPFVIE